MLVVFGCVRSGRAPAVACAVGGYVAAAYWFTSSTSFANPALTLARTLSGTAAGIAPASAGMFILMQLAGAALALVVIRILWPASVVPAVRPLGVTATTEEHAHASIDEGASR